MLSFGNLVSSVLFEFSSRWMTLSHYPLYLNDDHITFKHNG